MLQKHKTKLYYNNLSNSLLIIFFQGKYCVRFLDYGNVEYVSQTSLLSIPERHDVFKNWAPQAQLCCLFKKTVKDLKYHAKWLFNGAVSNTEVDCIYCEEVRL